MRILLLLPYAWDSCPSQRFRVEQWFPLLRQQGISFETATLVTTREQRLLYSPGRTFAKATMLIACLARRVLQLRNLRHYDAVWLHRAAFPIGPPWIERYLAWRGCRLVFEFDDAIYAADTAKANRAFSFLKWSKKTDDLCRLSDHVVVGNDFLAQYAQQFNESVTVVPTTIDTDTYPPRTEYRDASPLVIGWSGSRTTVAHLRRLDRVLQEVAKRVPIQLRVLGTPEYELSGVDTFAEEWTPENEIPTLQQFDVGVMPLPNEEWAKGKCGLKALQYMGIGIPTVVSPVGVNTDIVESGVNGIVADTEEEWIEALVSLAQDRSLRERLGRAGRVTVEERFSHRSQVPQLLSVLSQVTGEELAARDASAMVS